jgi:hypothetical protein
MMPITIRSLVHTIFTASVLLAAAAIHPPETVSAQEKVYEIAGLRASLEVRPDGSYRIREEITYDFQVGSFTFAERDIPLSNVGGVGRVTVGSPDVEVTAVEQEEEGDSWRTRWEFPPSTGLVTFVLDYEVRGALREVDETNEVFWRVVGGDWDVPFREVEAEISLPTSFSLSSADLTLDPPEISSARTEGSDLVARFVPGPLPAGRAYQVKVSFPKVMDGRAVGMARTENQALLAGILSFVLFLVSGGIAAFLRLGPRLPVRRQTHVGMDLPTASVLLHRESPSWDRVFPATLFDLADRGVVSLERVDRKKGFFTSQKVLLHRNDESDEVLTPFESAFLTQLGKYEDLEDFATKGKKFRKAAMKEVQASLVAAEYLMDLRSESRRLALLAIAVGVLAIATFVAGAIMGSPWLMAVAGAGLGIAVAAALVASVRFSRSAPGAERLAELKGYLEGVREELKQKTKRSPIGAAEFIFASLPWLTLDPKYTGSEGQKLARLLRKEAGELRTPLWALDRTKSFEKAAAKHSAAYAAYLPFTNVTGAASGAVAPSAGGGVGGAAGGGAAGGGGGGAG